MLHLLIELTIEIVKDKLKKDKFLNNEYISEINLNQNIQKLDKADRIALLQSAGNALRKKISKDVLAQLAIKEIAVKRDQEEDKATKENDKPDETKQERKSRRHVTIIDSLKNPSEVELLQIVYRDMFYMFGVLCPEDIRMSRLAQRNIYLNAGIGEWSCKLPKMTLHYP